MSFDAWLNSDIRGVPAATKAAGAWNRIQDKSTSITVYRGGVAQTAQTVRIEFRTTQAVNRQEDMKSAIVRELTIFGVIDHPDEDVSDTDLQTGDLFVYDAIRYEVIDVAKYPGEIQAQAVRMTGR